MSETIKQEKDKNQINTEIKISNKALITFFVLLVGLSVVWETLYIFVGMEATNDWI